MVDPVTALAVFSLLAVLAGVLAWPGRGIVARVRRRFRSTERVELEDALKHLVQCEREGIAASLENLAGRLEVTRGHAARLVSRLAALGLATADSASPGLTEHGRSTALRVLRTHRLWERWLADRTGVGAAEWHAQAERVEHVLSEAQTEELKQHTRDQGDSNYRAVGAGGTTKSSVDAGALGARGQKQGGGTP